MEPSTLILILNEISRMEDKNLSIELDSYDYNEFRSVSAKLPNGYVKIKLETNSKPYIYVYFDIKGANCISTEMYLPPKIFRLFYKHVRVFNKFKKKMETIAINRKKRELNEAISRAAVAAFPDIFENAMFGDDNDK